MSEQFKMPKISVITVTFNSKACLVETINSTLEQTYGNIEYIIVDGASTDGTDSVIKQFQNDIDKIISEPDLGIYDAMNKGFSSASGDYVLFMNAGDIFENRNIINQIFQQQNHCANGDLIVGFSRMVSTSGNQQEIWPRKSMDRYLHFPHQATFISKRIYSKYLYDQKFQISGDREYFARINNKENLNIKLIDNIVSRNVLGGVSNNGSRELTKSIEDLMVINTYNNLSLRGFTKTMVKTILKTLIYRYLSQSRRDYVNYFLFHKIPGLLCNLNFRGQFRG